MITLDDTYDYDLRKARGIELSKVLKIDDSVVVQSLMNVEVRKTGVVQAIEPNGFQVDNLWYGWHELESIVA